MSETTGRVRVTGPVRRRTRAGRPDAGAEIDADTVLGELYLQSLLLAQRRLAVGVTAVLVLTLGALPLVFHLVPELAQTRVLGIPVAFGVLAAGAYPLLLVLSLVYVRLAERNEHAFAAMLERIDEPRGEHPWEQRGQQRGEPREEQR